MTKDEAIVRLVLTCEECPEQYDAFIGQDQVGYLRLRHGQFRVDYPDCGGETIYTAEPIGDGIFEDHERDRYLRFAVDAILRRHFDGPFEIPAVPDVRYEITGRGRTSCCAETETWWDYCTECGVALYLQRRT